MAEILLTHSYFLRFDPKEYRAMMPYPPLGTITAAGLLRSRGYEVALHDVMLAESEEEIVVPLSKHRPSLVILYDDSFNYLTKMCLSRMRDAAFRMASLAKEHGCTVAVFSSDASDHVEEYLAHGVDFVLRGEAEQTLVELSDRILRGTGKPLSSIEGLSFRSGETIVTTHKRAVMKNLDSLPMAAWDLIDMERYRVLWKKRHGYFSLNITTTRGCPFHCNWCAKPLYGQVYNSRSPADVVREIEYLREHARPDHLWITDDIFGLKPQWVREFSRLMRNQKALVPFKCLSRADLLLENEDIRDLKLSGCEAVWMGAESGSQKILDAMDKGTTVEQIRQATKLLHENGIRVGFFLQFGYPGETWADIRKTLQLVRDCRPDEIGVSVSYPLPGTPFFDRVKEDLGLKHNWRDSQDLDLLFQGEYSRDFYRRLHTVVHKWFSVWKKTRELRDAIRHPGRLRPTMARSIAAIGYHLLTLPFHFWILQHERTKRDADRPSGRHPVPAGA